MATEGHQWTHETIYCLRHNGRVHYHIFVNGRECALDEFYALRMVKNGARLITTVTA